ncbi:MAG: hypothetical protein AAB403_23555 [Planctomycetota bacterium]
MTRPPTFFLAGTVQGSQADQGTVDQSYRTELRRLVTAHFPNAVVHCPVSMLHARYAGKESLLAAEFSRLNTEQPLQRSEYPDAVASVVESFREFVELAGQCDVLIAYLPGNEASMGTAMELWSAFERDRIIIVISKMTQHLAVLSAATLIVGSIEALGEVLSNRWLHHALEQKGDQP